MCSDVCKHIHVNLRILITARFTTITVSFENASASQAYATYILNNQNKQDYYNGTVLNVALVVIATSTEIIDVLLPCPGRYSLDYSKSGLDFAKSGCHPLQPLLDVGMPLCGAYYGNVRLRAHLFVAVRYAK
jgi:hypothetical protein